MEHIKQSFSIKDLEHLSGIKAHTIRIWEKRYNILNPDRTETNIRTYDGKSLQKLLNIAFLNEHGYKISRISKMTDSEIISLVKRITASSSEENRAMNAFKISMLNFDEKLFHETFRKLSETRDFRDIFHGVFLPLLGEIGMLWQTDTIKPIHEHYIVELIKQKIYLKISELKLQEHIEQETLYVLFLPENEIHDIGILYLNYLLLANGKNSMYLGSSLPLNNMDYILKIHDHVSFVSYLTISPVNTNVTNFIEEFQETICRDKKYPLTLLGSRTKDLENVTVPENITVHSNIDDFINTI